MENIAEKVIIEKSSTNELESLFFTTSISHSILSLIPYELAIEYSILPYGQDNKGRILALMAHPDKAEMLQGIQMVLGTMIIPQTVSRETHLKLIAHHYAPSKASVRKTAEKKKETRFHYNMQDSVINIVNDIIHEAIRLGASDIHLEPFEKEMCVRFRIDGVLQEITTLPVERILEIVSRIKILSRMDIAEKRRAQDGRIRISDQGRDVDIRVSTLPTDFGEKTVMRLLDKSGNDFSIDSMGLEGKRLSLVKKALALPNGIVLLTGPTGSGKTTSLYAAMNFIKKPGINISTVEDPIEYNISGVNQTQVNPLVDMTFANSLRTLLRQDPDVIMVGEMRDGETAEIAIRASLTGHLVLSTLHTNDAPSAITRLVDMNIEPYLVSSSVTIIIAQRLVRKICSQCKCETNAHDDIKESFGMSGQTRFYKGLGCSACGYTGYKGRTGIFEVLPISDTLRELINVKASLTEIRSQAQKEGLVSLREHALSKLADGITTVEEVLREVSVIT